MVWLHRLSGVFISPKFSTHHHLTKRFLESGVYISRCQDIFTNLALENWIYKHVQCENKNILLLWQNQPCVVIGRHQNPWTEVNLELLHSRGIPFARRKSGGGTVYHDLGNLNCTFFTSRKRYDRKHNLDLVVRAMKDRWNLNVKVNDRDDILLNEQYKISGTAAKLGKHTAYHHLTLLMNTDKESLFQLLNTPLSDFSTRATVSVKSDVMNLVDVQPDLCKDELMTVISEEYYSSVLYLAQVNPVFLDPTKEELFPGIGEMCTELKSWNWRYGWTPKFTIEKTFFYPSTSEAVQNHHKLLENNQYRHDSKRIHLEERNLSLLSDDGGMISQLTIELQCKKGCIECVRLTCSSGEVNNQLDQYVTTVIEGILKGVRFNYEDVNMKLQHAQESMMFVAEEHGLNPVLCEWIFGCIVSMTVPCL